MTEYDYSPAAYERYLAQQTRVSNWVHDTVQQSHAYSNPFVLSPTHRDRSFYDEPNDRTNQLDQWSMGSSRPSRTRSRSYVDQFYQNDRDRLPPSSRHRGQSHSHSSSTPRDIYTSQHPIYPQPHVTINRTPAPRNYHSQYPSSRQPYVTQPPPGQIYPNTTGPMPKDALYRHPSQRHSSKPPAQPYLLVQGGGPKAEYKRGPPIHAPVPMKPHGQQPILKRLLGFVTMSPPNGRSANYRGPRGSSY